MRVTLTLTVDQHTLLMKHLFPGDGNESVAIALCGLSRHKGEESVLVRQIIPIANESCAVRTPVSVTWSTAQMPKILSDADRFGLVVVKIHSHPGGQDFFSKTDDKSDEDFFSYTQNWVHEVMPHGSVILLPEGRMTGRTVCRNGSLQSISRIKLIGDDLKFWDTDESFKKVPEYATRIAQAFGEGTYESLRRLKVAVVGCSGTGSLVIELLSRNNVGSLVLVDPKNVEMKNLNRIPQATIKDAEARMPKVDIMARSISAMGFDISVETHAADLYAPDVVKSVASCDIVFGCMDSVDGRHLLNRIASFYMIPYFDIGVRLIADGKGGIDQVCGSVHYIKPGGSSLFSRGLYTLEEVRAAALYKSDPEAYATQLQAGYISGVNVDKPAVMSVNMVYAALAVNELLARLHPYRLDRNSDYDRHTISLSHGIYEHASHDVPCKLFSGYMGRGDVKPLLNMPALSQKN